MPTLRQFRGNGNFSRKAKTTKPNPRGRLNFTTWGKALLETSLSVLPIVDTRSRNSSLESKYTCYFPNVPPSCCTYTLGCTVFLSCNAFISRESLHIWQLSLTFFLALSFFFFPQNLSEGILSNKLQLDNIMMMPWPLGLFTSLWRVKVRLLYS